jgi:hypothetical protein
MEALELHNTDETINASWNQRTLPTIYLSTTNNNIYNNGTSRMYGFISVEYLTNQGCIHTTSSRCAFSIFGTSFTISHWLSRYNPRIANIKLTARKKSAL